MPKQITAIITFVLHDELEGQLQNSNPKFHDRLIEDAITDCLENERNGAALYSSTKVSIVEDTNLEEEI